MFLVSKGGSLSLDGFTLYFNHTKSCFVPIFLLYWKGHLCSRIFSSEIHWSFECSSYLFSSKAIWRDPSNMSAWHVDCTSCKKYWFKLMNILEMKKKRSSNICVSVCNGNICLDLWRKCVFFPLKKCKPLSHVFVLILKRSM